MTHFSLSVFINAYLSPNRSLIQTEDRGILLIQIWEHGRTISNFCHTIVVAFGIYCAMSILNKNLLHCMANYLAKAYPNQALWIVLFYLFNRKVFHSSSTKMDMCVVGIVSFWQIKRVRPIIQNHGAITLCTPKMSISYKSNCENVLYFKNLLIYPQAWIKIT